MKCVKASRVWLTAVIAGLALVVVVMVKPACTCVPMTYKEVELADVPGDVLERGRALAPRSDFQRAWRYGPGGRFDAPERSGYLLRSRVNWYQSRDVRVKNSRPEAEAETLEPID